MSADNTIEKSKAFGWVYFALFLGAIIGIIIAKTVIDNQIATAYIVETCQRNEDINGKYFRCDY